MDSRSIVQWTVNVGAPCNGVTRNALHERQRRSIIQPRVVSFQRNYPGPIPPNQTANPERVEFGSRKKSSVKKCRLVRFPPPATETEFCLPHPFSKRFANFGNERESKQARQIPNASFAAHQFLQTSRTRSTQDYAFSCHLHIGSNPT